MAVAAFASEGSGVDVEAIDVEAGGWRMVSVHGHNEYSSKAYLCSNVQMEL